METTVTIERAKILFGLDLQNYLEQRNISVEELSNRLNSCSETVYNYLQGNVPQTFFNLLYILRNDFEVDLNACFKERGPVQWQQKQPLRCENLEQLLPQNNPKTGNCLLE